MNPTFGCLSSRTKLGLSFVTFDDCCIKHKTRMSVVLVSLWDMLLLVVSGFFGWLKDHCECYDGLNAYDFFCLSKSS